MISISSKGDWKNTTNFLERVRNLRLTRLAEHYAKMGVKSLKQHTPRRTGATAESWSYEMKITDKKLTIQWNNDNAPNGIPVALLIQYGHATRNGGYVEGIDYINPALSDIFQKFADNIWKEVTKK